MIAPSLVVGAWLIGAWLSAVRATAVRHGLEDLYLFTIVADDQMADEDRAVHAGTGAQALEAAALSYVHTAL